MLAVGRRFSLALAEQMEDEEQRRRLRSISRFECEIGIDLPKEDGNQLGTLSRCCLQAGSGRRSANFQETPGLAESFPAAKADP